MDFQKIKAYFKKMKDFISQKYGKQGLVTNIFMILTIFSAFVVIVSPTLLFQLISLFFAIAWGISLFTGNKKKNNKSNYHSPDLEGMFLSWLLQKIKKSFGK